MLENSPILHEVGTSPGEEQEKPPGQEVHINDPEKENSPGLQMIGSWSGKGHIYPEGHKLHAVWPSAVLKYPGGHYKMTKKKVKELCDNATCTYHSAASRSFTAGKKPRWTQLWKDGRIGTFMTRWAPFTQCTSIHMSIESI